MPNYIPKITAEIAFKKFFLRELLSFFIEKREQVFGDAPLIFSVDDFGAFLERKKIRRVMSNTLNYNFIKAHLKLCRDLNKRNNKLRIIYPTEPILNFSIGDNKSFKVHCVTDYLKSMLKWLTESLKDDQLWEEKKKSLFKETREHKIDFLGKITKNSLEIKERGIFGTLTNNFNKSCSYGDMFNAIIRLNESSPNKKAKLIQDYNSPKKKKGYIDDGIQSLRNKLCKISGKPDAIKAETGRESKYTLTY